MEGERMNEIAFVNDLYLVFRVPTKSYPDAVTIIDKEDWERVLKYRWTVHNESGSLYVRSSDRSQVRIHRLIMNAPDNMFVDHIDNNTLINIKSNLQICTLQQNSAKQKSRINSIRGIRFRDNKWEVSIETYGRALYLGRHKDLVDAMKAYNNAAKILFGNFAVLHIIKEDTDVRSD
jgi:hypothetical protein